MTTSHTPSTASHRALRGVLVVLGAITAFVAANVAFGGLETLGLQGPTDYFEVTDHAAYLIRDSHSHFYGGVYLALGLFLIYASADIAKHRPTLYLVFTMIFAGGLARLTQMEPGVTFGPALLLSTTIELIGVPLLALWVARATRVEAKPVATALTPVAA